VFPKAYFVTGLDMMTLFSVAQFRGMSFWPTSEVRMTAQQARASSGSGGWFRTGSIFHK
jgi:hypothetical protein